MTPRQALEQRGIYGIADWGETPDYWAYPVYAPDGSIIGTRYKKYPFSDTKLKYHWGKEGKPETFDSQWYILPEADAPIRETGTMWLANGEPASLAFHAAGIHNVGATTLSEIAFPKDGVNYLKKRGINRLLYVVDNDKAGFDSAIVWRDSLAGIGIDLQVFTWGKSQENRTETSKQGVIENFIACADVEDKTDANDVWVKLHFDKQTFQNKLDNLLPLALPAQEKSQKHAAYIPSDSDYKEAYSKLSIAVFDALSAQGYLTGKRFASGFYQIRCPYHDDSESSAGFHPDSGVINCFTCKEPHGLKENAAILGIDWASYYPAKEGKKKPTKPEIKAFQQSIEAIPTITDNASYEDILRDEIMGRSIAYDAGQFIGFGAWQAFPLGILSAVFTLGHGRSKLALFLGKLHNALIAGEISSAYTEADAMRVTGFSRSAVSRCHFEAEHMGFVSILRGIISTIDSLNKVSIQKGGRPATCYLVEFDASLIQNTLRKMLEIFYLEKHAKKAIAMPTMQLARQFGASAETLRDWQTRAKSALEDKDNKAAKRAFDTEIFGNGGNWKGWDTALSSKFAANLDYCLYQDSLELRAALLKWWIAKVRDVNSREELCRLLGCTDPVIDKILDAANLTSDKQHNRVELPKLPETVKAMSFEFSRVQRELQGKCWKGGYWDTTQNAWIPFTDADYLDTYARFAGKITKAYMLVQSPSRQRPMTENEITKRDEERAKEETQVVTEVTVSKDSAISERRAVTYQKWDKHTYVFMYRQLQLMIHCFSPYALEGHVIIDKKGNAIASGKLSELFAWLLENGAKTPSRKVKSFYGKGYSEEADLVALQTLADERKAALGIKETWDFDDSPDSLPIFADMPKQAPMNFELNNPALVPTPQGYIYGSPDNDEYYDYLNNPYVSAWEQANREAKVKKWKAELKGIAS